MRDEGLSTRDGKVLNVQCLNLRYKPEAHIVEDFHYHKYHELIYLVSGEIETYIYDKQYYCKPGDTILIHSNEPHTFFRPMGCRCIVIKFIPEILTAYSQTSSEFEYIYSISKNISSCPRVISGITELKSLAIDAMRYFRENKYANEMFIRADIIKAYAHIIRFLHDNGYIMSLSAKTSAENADIIRRITAHTADVYGNIKTHDAAKLCGFSDGHFSRLFKDIIGVTFTEYTRNVRINEAIKLLRCTDDTVTDIAQKLGYSSSSHFICDFKRAKGVSPRCYRSSIAAEPVLQMQI